MAFPIDRSTSAFCALLALCAGPALAQGDGPRRINPMGGRAYMPLEHGARWEYRVTRPGGAEPITEVHVVNRSMVASDGSRIHQIETEVGGAVRYEYLSVTPRGVFRHPNRHLTGTPGVDLGSAPTRLLAAPVGLESRWEWEEKVARRAQRRLGRGAVENDEEISCVASLERVGERVTVPAGEFDTAHVAIARDGDASGLRTEHSWYARGVGLVKRTETVDGAAVRTMVLVGFTEGKPVLAPGEVLDRFLASTKPWSGIPRPESVEWLQLGDVELILRSKFALLRWNDKTLFVRIDGEQAAAFDPRGAPSYQAMMRAEGIEDPDGFGPPRILTAIAGVAVRLHAVDKGWDTVHGPHSQSIGISARAGGARTCKVETSYVALDADGRERKIQCTLKSDGDKLAVFEVR